MIDQMMVARTANGMSICKNEMRIAIAPKKTSTKACIRLGDGIGLLFLLIGMS
jgi:hypothetical protein